MGSTLLSDGTSKTILLAEAGAGCQGGQRRGQWTTLLTAEVVKRGASVHNFEVK